MTIFDDLLISLFMDARSSKEYPKLAIAQS